MPPGSGSETPAGTLAGERWLAVQADSAATQTTAAAATTMTARILIRRTTARPGRAGVSVVRAVHSSGWPDLMRPGHGLAAPIRNGHVSRDLTPGSMGATRSFS